MVLAKKLLHTRYRVNDLEKTVEFYKNVLGLEEVRRHKSPRGSELAFLKAPESEETVEICHFPNSGQVVVQEDLTHLAFEVDSLDGDRSARHRLQVDCAADDAVRARADLLAERVAAREDDHFRRTNRAAAGGRLARGQQRRRRRATNVGEE